MADILISGAVTADAQIANTIEPPTAGVHVGGGTHVVIPQDWMTQSMVGFPPAGCTAAQLNANNTMRVTSYVQAQILLVEIIAIVNALVGVPAVAAFNLKVLNGSPLP